MIQRSIGYPSTVTSQKVTVLISIILFCSITPLDVFGDDTIANKSCEILVDWDVEYNNLDSNLTAEIIHRYIVDFEPMYLNGTSPG